MRKYITIVIGGKNYRFLIDEELDKTLKSSLKERYKFDNSDTLIIDEDDLVNSYNLKQLILKSILSQINTYDLNSDLQKKIDSLKDYIGSKTNVYSSDLSKLDSILGEASEIYSSVRSNLSKKEIESEKREEIRDNLGEIKDILDKTDYTNDNINESTSSTDDKLEEFKEIVEELSYDEELKNKIPVTDINDAMDRVVICATMEEFIDKTANSSETYDVALAIKNKSEKIILPPNTQLEVVAVEILKTCINDDATMQKVISYIERKAVYKNKTNAALESLRSSLKISGLSARNLNYFGDQFFDSFEAICRESGISFESMFADYFNTYSANRRYNSPMDKFIRLFNKFNGGDDNTRALLEAMLVKKAISRGLIARKYNNYLKDEYKNLNVNGSGYINFNENSFRNIGGIASDQAHSVNIASEGHLGNNSNSYQSDINTSSSIASEEAGSPLNNVQNLNGLQEPHSDAISPTSLKVNKKNRARVGVVDASTAGIVTTKSQTNSRTIGAVGRRFASNTSLNPALLPEDDLIDDDSSEELDENNDNFEGDNSLIPTTGGSDLNDENVEDENLNEQSGIPSLADGSDDAQKKDKKSKILEFIKKNPWTWGAIGLVIFLLFLFLIIIASSNDDKGMNGSMGYYDAACNFNDTEVTIVDCEENKVLTNLNLKDYVMKMTYLYTKDNDYSDETIKALMIILKTNALSLGGYSSNNKDVTIRICDVYNGTVDENDLFNGALENLSTLGSLYEQVSEYLFISNSYKSSISSLSSTNAIKLDDDIIADLEKNASLGLKYDEILNTVFAVDEEENITISNIRENLFLGDSRTLGILSTSVIEENNTVYGVGYGYNWLVGSSGFNGTTNASNGGINAVNSKIVNGKLYNIIIWLGVNDLGNVNSYLEKYIELASGSWSGHNIYVVSVGPVQDSKSKYAKNEKITSFNNTIKDGITNANLSNLKYIDLGYTESSIKTYDNAGVHYGKEDYKNIYNKIISNLSDSSGPSVISTKLSLYKLSDYCTYYMLTENDAYWWPIGSKEPTNGNIYGDLPTTKTITSPFGIRYIDGKKSNHKGIDISGGEACYSNVIIASKSGIVRASSDACPTNGYYGNKCGGGYGNYVIIGHDDGTVTVYAHMSSGSITVKVGDTVAQGQKIGIMGSSGSSTGCHLHFEVRLDGTKVDPMNYVDPEHPRPMKSVYTGTGDGGTADENKKLVCESLLASGYSKNAVIGIMINIYHEGRFLTTNLENCYEENACCKLKNNKTNQYYDYGFCVHPEIKGFGSDMGYTNGVDSGAYPRDKFINDRAGYGLIQWTSSDRKAGLYDYAKSKNASIGSLDVQLGYLLQELQKKPYALTYKYITGNYSAFDTAKTFCLNFESPSNKETGCPDRANKYLAEYTEYVNNGCK